MPRAKKSSKTTYTKKQLLEWYRQMVLIRRFEERADELYQLEGAIKGFLHLYIGQEAVAVGSIAAREATRDHLITAYRDHGHALAVDIPANVIMAELMGKATGVVGGRGGSMHMADPEKLFWGGYGIVGAHLSLGVGMALTEQYNDTGGSCMCYFGEGSTNIGYFHESMNMARVWDLPMVFICENNKYGMGTSIEKASAVHTIVEKAAGYNIPSEKVDGNDIFAVYEATQKALDLCREGKGPYLLEMFTYRYEGHSIGDRTRYRPEGELAEWRSEKDPIKRLEDRMKTDFKVTEKQLQKIQDECLAVVDESEKFAKESPLPELSTLMDHIYVEN